MSLPSTGRTTNTMDSKVRFVPLVLLLIYLALKLAPHIKTEREGEYSPTSSQKENLTDVIDSLDGHPDAAKEFGRLYYGMALVVGSDEVIIKTTEDVRKAHENAGALAIQAGEIKRIPGYAKAVNDFLASEVGTDNVPLDADKRNKIVEAFKALVWATNQ